MASEKHAYRWAAIAVVLGLWLTHLPASAQVSASEASPPRGDTLEGAVQSLAEQVKHLNATIEDLRSDVVRSRQETRELREQLQMALERFAPAGNIAARTQKPVPDRAPVPVTAPVPPETPNTEARLDQLEEGQQLLKSKVDEQYQTKVESTSKYRMKVSGIVLLNLFGNSGRADNQDVPNLAVPRGPLDTGGSFGATVRQSELGFEVYGPTVAGANASADLHFDFFGGFPSTTNGVTAGLVRLRTGTVRLDWARTSLVAGQDAPFFSPLSPTSIASLAYPAFSDAGNLWTWTPQLRVEHRMILSDLDTFTVQAGLLDPLSGEPPPTEYYRSPQGGERSRQPAYASRLAWSHGESGHALTLGAGGYYSRQNYGMGRTVDAWAGTADWNVPLGNRFALSGEVYRGRALGGLGAAEGRSILYDGSLTNPNTDVVGLNSAGGWSQLKFKASETVEFNAAYGLDNPYSDDLSYYSSPLSYSYTSVARNQSEMFNVIYRPRTDLLFSLEYRHLNTFQISAPGNLAGQLNLSMGVLF